MIEFHSYRSADVSDVLVVELGGRLDTDSAEQFFEQLESEVTQGHTKIVFDCGKLTMISSLGFGMMIRGHSRVKQDGGGVRFACVQGMILEAFQIVGFHKLFQTFDTVDAAAQSFAEA